MKKQKKSKETNLWEGHSVISAERYTTDGINQLFTVADSLKEQVKNRSVKRVCEGRVLANVFYEPSTRTSSSFASAMQRLGGSVLSVNAESSSVKKGETLEDTMRCLECYSDIIVLRHPIKGSAAQAVQVLKKPLLNAGDGIGEHPTQALLDLYTIRCEKPTFDLINDHLHVILLGDLLNGRTVHSLVQVLPLQFKKLTIYLVSPNKLKMPVEMVDNLKKIPNLQVEEHETMNSCLSKADVLYVTRIQKERFDNEADYQALHGSFVVDANLLKGAKDTLTILHPLPRVNEIAVDVDSDPRAAYFRQMEYGMYVRMALIGLVLGDITL